MTERIAPRLASRVRLAMALALALAVFVVGAGNILALSTRNVLLAGQLAGWSGATVSKQAELLAQRPDSLKLIARIEPAARRAIAREPLDFKAARTLGSIAVRRGQTPLARRVFTLVGEQTLREPVAHLWLMGDDYARGRYPQFVREAEILLRQSPQMSPQIYLLFTRLVDRGLARANLLERLSADPSWRPGFFDAMGVSSQNSDAAYALFRDLSKSAAPARPSELRSWLLHELGRADAAVLVRRWRVLQRPALPPSEQAIRNPGFEGTVAPPPFDWTFFAPEGSFAEIGPSPAGGGKALYVELTGRNDQVVASQLLDLPPGRHRIATRIYPISDLGRRDLTLSLQCSVGKTFAPHARTSLVAPVEQWSGRYWDVTVPANCPVQQLTLGARPGALSTDLRAYFDDFAITRPGA